jgi:methionyl-tRNA synthetase
MNTRNQNSFTVTTPLYYVNDVPHIGHAYTTMAADTIARWYRLSQRDVLLITGTDEHGQKIERTAIAAGVDPQVHCDRIVARFDLLWGKLNIQYDRFSRQQHPIIRLSSKSFFNEFGKVVISTKVLNRAGTVFPVKSLRKNEIYS